jgi:peroxiredoxin
LNIESFNGKGRNVLPVPATFVIDKNGIIRAAFADTDYKKRMEPAAILAALKKL